MEYSTAIRYCICKKSYCLEICVPIKHTLQIMDFVSGLDTDSDISTSAFNIRVYNDENILQYIEYELGKFISNIESAERCYSEIFMEKV